MLALEHPWFQMTIFILRKRDFISNGIIYIWAYHENNGWWRQRTFFPSKKSPQGVLSVISVASETEIWSPPRWFTCLNWVDLSLHVWERILPYRILRWVHHKAHFSWRSQTRDLKECNLFFLLSKIFICSFDTMDCQCINFALILIRVYIQDFGCWLRSERLTSGGQSCLRISALPSYMAVHSDLVHVEMKNGSLSFLHSKPHWHQNKRGEIDSLKAFRKTVSNWWPLVSLFLYLSKTPFIYLSGWGSSITSIIAPHELQQRDLSRKLHMYIQEATYICTHKNSLLERDGTTALTELYWWWGTPKLPSRRRQRTS